MLKYYITIKGQYEGFHRYVDAPPAVDFLRYPHRHLFKWELTTEVYHDDRELEFFLVKLDVEREILNYVNTKEQQNLGSCEMQAEELIEGFQRFYGKERIVWATVSEDGENSATVKYIPDSESVG